MQTRTTPTAHGTGYQRLRFRIEMAQVSSPVLFSLPCCWLCLTKLLVLSEAWFLV